MLEIVTFNTLLMLDRCSSLGLRFDVTGVTGYDNLEVRFSVINPNSGVYGNNVPMKGYVLS